MRDPNTTFQAGQTMQVNAQRATRCALIQAGLHPGIEPNESGYYAVSFHSTINSAYVTQHRLRALFPHLNTHVKKSEEWAGVIYVKRSELEKIDE